jgi:peroxiredoxin
MTGGDNLRRGLVCWLVWLPQRDFPCLWKRIMKFLKHPFILLLLLVLCLAPMTSFAMETGEPAPGFTLKNLQGQDISLADFKGRLVLLKLATTWCPTCKQLSAEIEKIGSFLKEHDVVVLDVFLQDSEEMVEKYLGDSQHPMTFHALLDDGKVYQEYNVYVIPRLLVVDADQIIRFDSAGNGSLLAKDIITLVKELSPQAGAAGST